MFKRLDILSLLTASLLALYLFWTLRIAVTPLALWADTLPSLTLLALLAVALGASLCLLPDILRWSRGALRRTRISMRADQWLYGCLIIDTETTGLGPDAEIVEISIVNELGHIVFSSLVKPSQPIPPAASAISGITNAMLADAPRWADIASQLFCILRSRDTHIAYNADYDARLIRQTCERYNIAAPELHFSCAMRAAAKYIGQWDTKRNAYKWQKLTTAAALLKVSSTRPAHRASADCLLTLDIIKQMANQTKPLPQDTPQ